jgi:alcohol dehydrogenase class IV
VRGHLGDELAGLRARRVAVIADRGFTEAGLLEPLLAVDGGAQLSVCALIGEDPGVAEAEQAAAAALDWEAEAVLGVGGGSALCAAKAAAIRLTNPGPIDVYAGAGRLGSPPAPVIAIPTTAGSGSEVSNVVVLHDPRHTGHVVIRGRGYEPGVAMLDGEMLRTLPRRPQVAAGLDALSHAFEALWVHGASPFTDALAFHAAAIITEKLPLVVEGGSDEDRQALIEASAIANLACGNSGLGLVHALTSSPTVHLAHGYQNGVLLGHVARFNSGVVGDAVKRQLDELDALYRRIGFPDRFAAGELAPGDADTMVQAALVNPFRDNNRRLAGEADLRAILAAAGAPPG